MSLRVLTRKIKMDLTSTTEDICELLFAQKAAQKACRLFLDYLKRNNGLTRREVSQFAWDLAAGRVEGFKYGRVSFYRHVRRTLLTLGLVAIEQRFVGSPSPGLSPERERKFSGIVDKYVAVRQPISKRPPDGVNLVRFMWILCKRWNDEFLEGDE